MAGRRNPSRTALFIFALLALLIMGLAGVLAWQRLQFVRHAVSAQGKVIDLESERDNSGESVYHTVFTFKDQAGQKHRIRDNAAHAPPANHRGETVEVIYTPEDPEAAKIRSFGSLWEEPTIVGGIGLAMFIGACVTIFSRRPRNIRSAPLPEFDAQAEHSLPVNFESAIKNAYPQTYPDICALGREFLGSATASALNVHIEDRDFSKFISRLDYKSSRNTNNGRRYKFRSELTCEWDNRNVAGGRVHGGVDGIISRSSNEITMVELAQHQLLFLRWNEDDTRVFKDDQLLVTVDGIYGKHLTVRMEGNTAISVTYPTWPWQKTKARINNGDAIVFPPTWPSPRSLGPEAVKALAAIPITAQISLIAVLLWRNDYTSDAT